MADIFPFQSPVVVSARAQEDVRQNTAHIACLATGEIRVGFDGPVEEMILTPDSAVALALALIRYAG